MVRQLSSTNASEIGQIANQGDVASATNATATETITPASGKSVYLTDVAGSYSAAAIGLLTIAGPNGTGGGATAVLAPTTVASVAVGAGGSGYTTPPSVIFTGGSGTGAAAHAVLTGDAVTSIVVDSPGSGYTGTVTVTLSGGGGTGATATALLTATTVASILTVQTEGSVPYSVPPTLAFSGGGGSGAAARAVIAEDGSLSSAVVTAAGSGYTSAPTIAVGAGAQTFKSYIHNAGNFPFPKALKFAPDAVVTITLAAGGSGVVGQIAQTHYEA